MADDEEPTAEEGGEEGGEGGEGAEGEGEAGGKLFVYKLSDSRNVVAATRQASYMSCQLLVMSAIGHASYRSCQR